MIDNNNKWIIEDIKRTNINKLEIINNYKNYSATLKEVGKKGIKYKVFNSSTMIQILKDALKIYGVDATDEELEQLYKIIYTDYQDTIFKGVKFLRDKKNILVFKV